MRPSSPVVRIAKLTSLTPSWPRYASHSSSSPGTAPHTITNRFANRPSNSGPGRAAASAAPASSEVDIEVHPRVEARHLIGVAVEQERLAPAGLADPLLGGLAPPRVRVAGVDVREEAVLVRSRVVPRRRRLRRDQRDLDDRLDPLEAVLPWGPEPHRPAVLRWQLAAVEPGREQGQRVHRLGDPTALDLPPG